LSEEFRRVVSEAKKLPYPYNHIRMLAYIATRVLGNPSEIKIVRGLAAAYYTDGKCTTAEADIYSPKLYNNPDILEKLGFKQHREYLRSPWILEETDTVLDFVGLDIPFRFIEVEIGGDSVQIMSPEDTLANYLAEVIHSKPSKEAVQRTNLIFLAQKNRINEGRLREALERMNAYESFKKNPPRTFAKELCDELIEFLEDVLRGKINAHVERRLDSSVKFLQNPISKIPLS